MKLPEPQTKTFSNLIDEIEKGQIKIPQFQRDFVWTIQKSASLIDSIIKGYPIGTFILWRTKERLRSVKNIGGIDLPDTEEGEYVDFVLDGQQRLTSLFAALKGITIIREGNRKEDFRQMYINLSAKEDEQIVSVDFEENEDKNYIKVTDLLYGGLTLLASYPPEHLQTLEEYKKRIESYSFSAIQIKEAPIDIATEIFTRINVGGQPLSLFEIMVAKTYDYDRDFDLAEKYDDLIDRLRNVNYETVSDATILQSVSMIMAKECKRKVILTLDKQAFIDIWDDVIDAIEKTVDYFRTYYRIPVSKLLPYNALVVPFAYFFYKHKDKPTGDKQKYLEDYFWRCSLSGRYSSATESKLAQDIKRIDLILDDKLPKYDWAIDTSTEFIINNGWFSAGRSYIKAILAILAYQQPKSFIDNSIVNINNGWLKQANSKNYHHFFPKAYLKKEGKEEFYINHILNITIVDDFLNKRKIKAKAPSIYMQEFIDVNPTINATMKTHLIGDFDTFGIHTDDYDAFVEQRAELISDEIESRIIKQDIDREEQVALADDYEEDPSIYE
jgi:hypothetical protein